jgi:hypothetical protein
VSGTPRELRHSFVSLLSDGGVLIEQISRLVGHSGTAVTELVYRKQIRPVVEDGAVAMDRLFPHEGASRSSPCNVVQDRTGLPHGNGPVRYVVVTR